MKNREIKFRAYQDNGMLVQPLGGVYATKRFLGLLYEDTQLMQYTGLKDKKAERDVFEGDIYFDVDKNEDIERKLFFVITWINERAAFAMLEESEYALYISDGFNAIERDFDGFYFEITQDSIDKMQYAGNIHQHSELLTTP